MKVLPTLPLKRKIVPALSSYNSDTGKSTFVQATSDMREVHRKHQGKTFKYTIHKSMHLVKMTCCVFQVLVCLLQCIVVLISSISMFCAMAGAKRAPEGKKLPAS
jgi:hypothetical protein